MTRPSFYPRYVGIRPGMITGPNGRRQLGKVAVFETPKSQEANDPDSGTDSSSSKTSFDSGSESSYSPSDSSSSDSDGYRPSARKARKKKVLKKRPKAAVASRSSSRGSAAKEPQAPVVAAARCSVAKAAPAIRTPAVVAARATASKAAATKAGPNQRTPFSRLPVNEKLRLLEEAKQMHQGGPMKVTAKKKKVPADLLYAYASEWENPDTQQLFAKALARLKQVRRTTEVFQHFKFTTYQKALFHLYVQKDRAKHDGAPVTRKASTSKYKFEPWKSKLEAAIKAWTGGQSYKAVTKKYGIPQSTLEDHTRGAVRDPSTVKTTYWTSKPGQAKLRRILSELGSSSVPELADQYDIPQRTLYRLVRKHRHLATAQKRSSSSKRKSTKRAK